MPTSTATDQPTDASPVLQRMRDDLGTVRHRPHGLTRNDRTGDPVYVFKGDTGGTVTVRVASVGGAEHGYTVDAHLGDYGDHATATSGELEAAVRLMLYDLFAHGPDDVGPPADGEAEEWDERNTMDRFE